jgi:hypothetical protein
VPLPLHGMHEREHEQTQDTPSPELIRLTTLGRKLQPQRVAARVRVLGAVRSAPSACLMCERLHEKSTTCSFEAPLRR